MATIEVKVPNIGNYKDVPVIDVLVAPGQKVEVDAPLVTLESDKATMDVPAPAAGTVRDLKVKVGDRVQEGSVVLTLDQGDGAERTESDAARGARKEPVEGKDAPPAKGAAPEPVKAPAPATASAPANAARTARAQSRGEGPARASSSSAASAPSSVSGPSSESDRSSASRPQGAAVTPGAPAQPIEVKVPSIGNYADVPVIDVLVKPGDTVDADAPLVTLESDKATMDVPAPMAGTVRELKVKAGDRVSEGSVVLLLAPSGGAPQESDAARAARLEPVEGRDGSTAPAAAGAAAVRPESGRTSPEAAREEAPRPAPAPTAAAGQRGGEAATREGGGEAGAGPVPHAAPSVRKLARELGVELREVNGSGPKGRILHDDVQRFVKETLTSRRSGGGGVGLDIAPWPQVDFASFGPVEVQPLSRIRKLSKAYLARNWVMIPHVTQHDEADVTELERFRQQLNEENAKEGVKVTLLAFVVKACVAALKKYPEVNASLDGDQLVLKRYFHIGFAADTPNGLVVPVVRDADRKGVIDIARELAALAAKAREGKLGRDDIQGGSFSISSLGGIGGTAFTPIINAPEVAILGVSRSAMRPVWNGSSFEPRLILPLSLSYDHRVVDGALGARFVSFVAAVLGDMRRAML